MPRSRGRRRPPTRPPPPPPPKKDHWQFVTPRRLWSAILAFCTLLGVIVLWPRITIDPDRSQIDPLHPFPVSFTIRNTGFIPLENLRIDLGLCTIWTGPPMTLPDRCQKVRSYLYKPEWRARRLARDEPFQIRLDDLLNIVPPAELGAADISVRATFYPWIIPYNFQIEHRFQTRPAHGSRPPVCRRLFLHGRVRK
jgi:hypothetical protein